MCTKYIIFILFLSTSSVSSQSLISNGDFEQLRDCPKEVGDINFAYGWHNGHDTPDLFSRCTNGKANGLNVPDNYVGSILPINGKSYSGIYLFEANKYSSTKQNFLDNESIWTKLSSAVYPSKTYKLSLWVALADSSVFFSDYMTATLSVTPFSDKPYDKEDNTTPAQVLILPLTKDMRDKNWKLISITFTPDKKWNYISIGLSRRVFDFSQYKSFLNKNIVKKGRNEGAGYYYLDDISLIEIQKPVSQ